MPRRAPSLVLVAIAAASVSAKSPKYYKLGTCPAWPNAGYHLEGSLVLSSTATIAGQPPVTVVGRGTVVFDTMGDARVGVAQEPIVHKTARVDPPSWELDHRALAAVPAVR